MAKELSIVKVWIHSRSEANGRPLGGDVEFSDGKYYGFASYRVDDPVRFYTNRKLRDENGEKYASILMSFESPKRAKLLQAEFDKV